MLFLNHKHKLDYIIYGPSPNFSVYRAHRVMTVHLGAFVLLPLLYRAIVILPSFFLIILPLLFTSQHNFALSQRSKQGQNHVQ